MSPMIREVQASYLTGAESEIGRELVIVQRNGEDVAVLVPITDGQVAATLVTRRDGKLIGAVVPPGEYESYRKWKDRQTLAPAAGDSQFERERSAFYRLLPELLKTHRDEWVAIVDEQPVQFGPSFSSVIVPLRKRFGQRPVYVQEVRESPRVYRVPSPRVIRR